MKRFSQSCYDFFIERIYRHAKNNNHLDFFNVIADSLSSSTSKATLDNLKINLEKWKNNETVSCTDSGV